MKSLSLTQPHAIVMVGIPGSGKTFFATKFSDTFHAPLVSTEHIAPHARDAEAAHRIADTHLDELLKTGQSLVLEVAASTRTERMNLAKKLRSKGYTPLIVWVQTDEDTARQRIAKDKAKDESTFDGQVRRFTPPHENEKPLVISGKHTYASQAKVVLKRLSAPRADISTHTTPPVRRHGSIVVR